ncbi:hypothetical protein ES703_73964 [subsurface metagenome]
MLKEKVSTLMIVLLIVGLVAGYAAGWYTAPETIKEVEVPGEVQTVEVEVEVEVPVYPLKGEIPIGCVVATSSNIITYAPLIKQGEAEINDYLEKMGLDFTLRFYVSQIFINKSYHRPREGTISSCYGCEDNASDDVQFSY